MIFGVDFDGTLSFGQWPETGEVNHELKIVMDNTKFSTEVREKEEKKLLRKC